MSAARLDVERVHEVITRTQHGRRCGKTVAFCCTIAGEVELSDMETFVVLVPFVGRVTNIVHTMRWVFDELGIQAEWNREGCRVTDTGKEVIVMTPQRYNKYQRGRNAVTAKAWGE